MKIPQQQRQMMDGNVAAGDKIYSHAAAFVETQSIYDSL